MSRIEDVQIIPRRLIGDERGWFVKVIDGGEEHLPQRVGEVYLTQALPGQARGDHYHPKTAEWFTIVSGEAELIVQELDSGLRKSWTLSGTSPATVYVPAGLAHVFVNAPTAQEPFILVAYAENRYDPEDTIPTNILGKARS